MELLASRTKYRASSCPSALDDVTRRPVGCSALWHQWAGIHTSLPRSREHGRGRRNASFDLDDRLLDVSAIHLHPALGYFLRPVPRAHPWLHADAVQGAASVLTGARTGAPLDAVAIGAPPPDARKRTLRGTLGTLARLRMCFRFASTAVQLPGLGSRFNRVGLVYSTVRALRPSDVLLRRQLISH